MAILKVARLGNPVLRAPAAEIPAAKIAQPDFQRFIDDMVTTMHEYQGVGLAAVQVHEPMQVAVLEVADNARYPGKAAVPLSVLINPTIVPLDDETEEDWEGCLSIPEIRGRVPRYKSLHVTALDREGTSWTSSPRASMPGSSSTKSITCAATSTWTACPTSRR